MIHLISFPTSTRIKSSQELNHFRNRQQVISVDVIPFWGDVKNFEIGITRQDFRIRSVLVNTFTIFGSVFTDGSDAMWGGDSSEPGFNHGEKISELYHIRGDNKRNLGMVTKRIGKVTEKIYYIPNTISDTKIASGDYDPKKDMVLMESNEYS